MGKVAKCLLFHESRANFLPGYRKPIPFISMLRSEKCLLSVFLYHFIGKTIGVGRPIGFPII